MDRSMRSTVCPNCDAKINFKSDVPAGKRVACPKCETRFQAVDADDEPDDKPRKSRTGGRTQGKDRVKQKAAVGPSTGMIVGIVAAIVLLIGGGVTGLILATRTGGSSASTITSPSLSQIGQQPAVPTSAPEGAPV
jgi:predicted Zn finger-like uncharacterized protein